MKKEEQRNKSYVKNRITAKKISLIILTGGTKGTVNEQHEENNKES